METLLVTGSSGMVGSNICLHPHASKYRLLLPTSGELDLTDYTKVIQWFKTHKPSCVIHAAGIVGGIQANIKNPVKFFVDNMRMGINILEASRLCGVSKFINLASSCMYPKDAINPLKEDLLLTGALEPTNEGYALAKIGATRLCQYYQSSGVHGQYKTLIPCNIYGLYDSFSDTKSHMIPAVIKKIHAAVQSNSDTVMIWGDGQSRREFMYSEDLADAIWYALENLDALPDVLNIGIGYDYSIYEYYQAIAAICGFEGNFEFDLSKPSGMKQKLVDTSIINRLGWKHSYELHEGLRKTYDFYQSTLNNS